MSQSKNGAPASKKAKLDEIPSGIRKVLSELRLQTAKDVTEFKFREERVKLLQGDLGHLQQEGRNVVYWMSRDQRVQDNWALLHAQRLALRHRLPLHVVFCLVPKFLDATLRHYDFMIRGLQEVEGECRALDINFHLLPGPAVQVLPEFVQDFQVGCVVTDFSPLRVPRQWVAEVQSKLDTKIPFYQVDAHNVVPVWETSEKQEYAARTIRGKITKKLDDFLTEFPPVIQHPHVYNGKKAPQAIDWKAVFESLTVDTSVGPVTQYVPGTRAGLDNLEKFCEKRIKLYADKRNDPNVQALSNISPWAHFGQISVQRAATYVKKHGRDAKGVAGFTEEAIVRRELADNFCYYQTHYDSIEGAFDWAKKSLELHRDDVRPYLYTREELETAKTHDDLWNAAQLQMVNEGKMHGFLRMYWAKKILEWTPSPEEGLATAIYLNDRYQLDGRDPNGYVGCMWSICGIHDQGWAERKVFGKIRYMNYEGCKRKFDIKKFIFKYEAKAYPYKKK
eukprot:maker-scaffold41_size498431-snap-gene-2.13 protein:Tk00201 transcript:maker-scaffold41_size498431-snap-gene-2.13-mRNA-1 annotation:"dna photolyase"